MAEEQRNIVTRVKKEVQEELRARALLNQTSTKEEAAKVLEENVN